MLEKRLLASILSRTKVGTVTVTLWDGDTQTYGSGKPSSHITIKNIKALRAIISNVSLGVGESYMSGDLLISEPIADLLEIGHFNYDVTRAGLKRFRGGKTENKNTKHKQRDYIAKHYDLGNDFYHLWLDQEAWGYTCAYYKTDNDTLEQAQVQKYDHVIKKLQLKKGQSLIDLGCGWGYLLVRAAKQYGITGVGVTLSSEQVARAREYAKEQGVEKQVRFELMNYQDTPTLGQTFDRVVSVGMLEHVGQHNHRQYFEVVDKLLKPKGISVLHSISQQKEVSVDPWLDRYIFPGGYIPSIREITALLPEYNFYLTDYENIGPHYARTLLEWSKRFEENKEQVIEDFDENFYRMWRFYLAGCVAAFRSGSLGLSHWVFSKGFDYDRPLTREHLYK